MTRLLRALGWKEAAASTLCSVYSHLDPVLPAVVKQTNGRTGDRKSVV
jgi:hypothetical protein